MIRRILCFLLALILLVPTFAAEPVSDAERLNFLMENIQPLKREEVEDPPHGMHHYLLISMDCWQNNLSRPGYNDGIVILTMDEVTGRVIVTSIIRDLWVKLPGDRIGRINRLMRNSGIEGLLDIIATHFGIVIDKYIVMDWRHIMEIVDAAGGVTVRLTESEASYLKGWSVPENSTTPVLKGAGEYHLNGFSAVIYMRIRKRRSINDVDTQDFGRTFRVRYVLSQIAKNISGYNIAQAENLLEKMLEILEAPYDKDYTYPGIKRATLFRTSPIAQGEKRSLTNISAADVFEALSLAYSLRDSDIESIRLPFDGTSRAFDYLGNAGQYIDFNKNRELLHDFLYDNSYVVTEGRK